MTDVDLTPPEPPEEEPEPEETEEKEEVAEQQQVESDASGSNFVVGSKETEDGARTQGGFVARLPPIEVSYAIQNVDLRAKVKI